MSDAANNALLFDEEIDRRVVDAFISTMGDPRREQETEYVVRALIQHPAMREHIYREVEYHVKRLIETMYPRHNKDPYNPRISMDPHGTDWSRYKW